MYVSPLVIWFILVPLVELALFLLGLVVLFWLDAACTALLAGAAAVARPLRWCARHGVPIEYAIPAGLALVPVVWLILALLR